MLPNPTLSFQHSSYLTSQQYEIVKDSLLKHFLPMPSGAPFSPDSPYAPLAGPPQPSSITPLISLNLKYCSAFGSQSSELFFLYSLLGDLTQSHSFKYNLYADYSPKFYLQARPFFRTTEHISKCQSK